MASWNLPTIYTRELRPKFESQCADAAADCEGSDELDESLYTLASDIVHDAGVPEQYRAQVINNLLGR